MKDFCLNFSLYLGGLAAKKFFAIKCKEFILNGFMLLREKNFKWRYLFVKINVYWALRSMG